MNESTHIYVIGAGLMGVDISTAFLVAGYQVTLLDVDAAMARRGVDKILKKVSSSDSGAARRIQGADMNASFDPARIVIEAVTESATAKNAVLSDVSARVRSDVPIYSNTSTLSISTLAKSVRNPARFAGLHFFFPAHRNRFLEIIRTSDTDQQTIGTARQIADELKKLYVMCPDRPGFIVNAFYLPFINEAVTLVDEGLAAPMQVDAVAKSLFGMEYGPLAVTAMMNAATSKHTVETLVEQGACTATAPSILSGQAREFNLNSAALPLTAIPLAIVRDRLRAALMLPTLRILDEGHTTPAALATAALAALQFRTSPIAAMAEMGSVEVTRVIQTVIPRWNMQLPVSIQLVNEFSLIQEQTE